MEQEVYDDIMQILKNSRKKCKWKREDHEIDLFILGHNNGIDTLFDYFQHYLTEYFKETKSNKQEAG